MKELITFRKYLTEGRLFEEDSTIGYEDAPESIGKPYAIEARTNMLFDEDENGEEFNLKTLDGKKDKTFVLFTTSYWDGEEEDYTDIMWNHDDKEKFGKIFDYESKNPNLFSTVLDPETGKEMIEGDDYFDYVEGAFDIEDMFYFKTQEELIKFDLNKYLEDFNQRFNK